MAPRQTATKYFAGVWWVSPAGIVIYDLDHEPGASIFERLLRFGALFRLDFLFQPRGDTLSQFPNLEVHDAVSLACEVQFHPIMNFSASARSAAVMARDFVADVLGRMPGSSLRFGPPRVMVADTPRWARGLKRSHLAGSVRLLTPARDVERPAIGYASGQLAARFAAMRQGTIKARFVAELPQGRLWGRGYGYAIDADDALHRDLSPCFDDFGPRSIASPVRHDGMKQPVLPRVQRCPGTVAAIGTLFCENFHHWLLDTLPKFGVLRDAGWKLDEIGSFLLPVSARCAWHRETFALLGISESKIRYTDLRTHIQADRLLVPSYSEPGREPERYNYTPEGIEFVRQLFLSGRSRRRDLPRNILVSRELAGCRRWIAGDDGYARLENAGFVKICLERYSLVEQAEFFARAERIVMPTGGGLANLVFCQPGARVIELFSPAYLPMFSAVIAGQLGFDYRALVGRGLSGRTEHSDEGGSEDIFVPAASILEQLS